MDTSTQSNLMIIAAIGAQIILIVAAIFNGWTAMAAKRIAEDTKAETNAQTVKIDSVAKDAAVVLGHVNSEKTSDAKTIEFQARENLMLRDQLAEKDRIAGLLAQARVSVDTAVAPRVVVANGVSVKATDGDAHQVKMEKNMAETAVNTEKTAVNTAKTDATVNELKKEGS